jgi:hypothetical protein
MKSGFLTICIVFIYLSAWSQELQENLSIEDLESDTLVTVPT